MGLTIHPRRMSGSVYGIRVYGRLPAAFQAYLWPEVGSPDGDPVRDPVPELRIEHRLAGEPPGSFEGPEIWASETDSGGRFALHRLADGSGGFGLAVDDLGRGRFRCSAGAIGIEWTEAGTGAPHYLFTYALPLWLETRGVPVLHGSAVAVDAPPGGSAVAFLGPSGTGKSVLCAELLARGCGFVADDGLALRRDAVRDWRCALGPPLLRLWPSGIERAMPDGGTGGGGSPSRPRVHEELEKRRIDLAGSAGGGLSGDGGAGPRLAAVYVLHRRREASGGVEVTELGARDGLVHLIEHGIAGAPAAALGLSTRRLALLAELAEQVPVRRLSFPSAPDSADRILDAISI